MKRYRPAGNANFVQHVQEQQKQEQTEEKKRHRGRITGAHTTMPIKDMRMVRRWLDVAKQHDANMKRGGVSWYLLVVLGFNTGLRIGDICKLRVRDVRDRERIAVEAQKTGKEADFPVNLEVQQVLSKALKGKSLDDYVLSSRQRDRRTGRNRPVSRQRAYAIVREVASTAGYEGHVGCHTMRKTYAWNYYIASDRDLSFLQQRLNHSSQEATLHYLGLDRDARDEVSLKVPSMI